MMVYPTEQNIHDGEMLDEAQAETRHPITTNLIPGIGVGAGPGILTLAEIRHLIDQPPRTSAYALHARDVYRTSQSSCVSSRMALHQLVFPPFYM